MMRLLGLLFVVGMVGFGASCANSSPRPGFTKMKTYRLAEKMPLQEHSSSRMITFERDRLLHGAVTEADKRKRYGHYYTFHWRSAKVGQPATLLLEYRQALTGDKTHRIEQTIPTPKPSNRSAFVVTGEAFEKNGRVVAWRCQLFQGGALVDSTQSFLWR